MLPSIEYATLLQYSPKGKSDLAVSSRKLMADIKNGHLEPLKERLAMRLTEHQDRLKDFLNAHVTLVPAPRSSPLTASALWPAGEIATMLALLGLGTVSPCLARETPVRKSALYPKADDRPSITEHYNSFGVTDMVSSHNITLVDDVLTLGRTLLAAGSRLADRFPSATIRAFALMQTKGRSTDKDIDTILNVQVGTITYNPRTGKCQHTQQ